jgi:hypothetical protein
MIPNDLLPPVMLSEHPHLPVTPKRKALGERAFSENTVAYVCHLSCDLN